MSTGFNKIDVLDLASEQYGVDLNTMLTKIDGNFKYLSENAFLKGEKGDSILVDSVTVDDSVSGYYLNGSQVNLFRAIKGAIEAIATEEDSVINGKRWHSDLDGLTIQVLYTKFDGANGDEKHIQSIFPFTYIDSRFKNLDEVNSTNYQAVTDHSCSVSMNASGFVAYQNTPTIFWNSEIGEFCWKINGNQTDIVCKGPAGTDGLPGSTYVVYVTEDRKSLPVDNTQKVRDVLCVLGWYQENGAYKYGQIAPKDFVKYGIKLETGLSVFAFPAKEVAGERYERVLDEGQSICMISQVLKAPTGTVGEYQYYVYSNDTDQLIFQMLEQTNLKAMLDGIGDYGDGSVRGLYVPTGKTSRHIIWTNPLSETDHSLNIGHQNDVVKESATVNDELNVCYNKINFKTQTTINEVQLLSEYQGDSNTGTGGGYLLTKDINVKGIMFIDNEEYMISEGRFEYFSSDYCSINPTVELPYLVYNTRQWERNTDEQDRVYFFYGRITYMGELCDAWIRCNAEGSWWRPISELGKDQKDIIILTDVVTTTTYDEGEKFLSITPSKVEMKSTSAINLDFHEVNVNTDGFTVNGDKTEIINNLGSISLGKRPSGPIDSDYNNGKYANISIAEYDEMYRVGSVYDSRTVGEIAISADTDRRNNDHSTLDLSRILLSAPNREETEGLIKLHGGTIQLNSDEILTLDGYDYNISNDTSSIYSTRDGDGGDVTSSLNIELHDATPSNDDEVQLNIMARSTSGSGGASLNLSAIKHGANGDGSGVITLNASDSVNIDSYTRFSKRVSFYNNSDTPVSMPYNNSDYIYLRGKTEIKSGNETKIIYPTLKIGGSNGISITANTDSDFDLSPLPENIPAGTSYDRANNKWVSLFSLIPRDND